MNDIRPYQGEDAERVIAVWHGAGIAEYTYLPTWQAFTLEHASKVFREHIAPRCDIWVGTTDGFIVGYLAMVGSYIDRLYVDPASQGMGWGSRFLDFARSVQPAGLELHTHQDNKRACAIYEHHGFEAVKFGISPPPESAPDVEYHWRP